MSEASNDCSINCESEAKRTKLDNQTVDGYVQKIDGREWQVYGIKNTKLLDKLLAIWFHNIVTEISKFNIAEIQNKIRENVSECDTI